MKLRNYFSNDYEITNKIYNISNLELMRDMKFYIM